MNIAVASGKGGTGKTLISTSLALSYSGSAYIDMDVEEPNGAIFIKPEIEKSIRFTVPIPEFNENTCTFCGKCAEACAYNAISVIPQAKKILFFNELCHNCGVCSFVCPVPGTIVEKPKEIGTINFGNNNRFIEGILDIGIPSAVPLINGIKKYFPKQGITIIDSPPGTSCPVVETIKESSFVILVTEPTPFGLNDLELALQVVRDLKKPHGLVVNKHDENNDIARKFAREKGLKILLEVPFSRKIAEGYSRGIPLLDSIPQYRDVFKDIIKKISAGTV